MVDLIDRQAAIDAVRDRMGKGETNIGDTFIECFEMILNALPSAQPNLQPTCNQLATDCISRQGVLNWLNDEWDGMVLSVFDGIRNLPSAQPEPQWIPCSQPPETDENVFIARGNENFMSCCIGHYDLDAETWYEDRNWFALTLYDALYWCKMLTLPESYKEKDNERA